MQSDRAESIGVSALLFLAGDTDRLVRFLTLTGLGPAELRIDARSPRILAAVLDHLLQDESLLLVFCASDGVPPEDIAPARRILAEIAGEIGDPDDQRLTGGRGGGRVFALALFEEGQLLQLAADGEVAVVDVEARGNAVLIEAERQLVGRERVEAAGPGLEIADRDRPGGEVVELIAVDDFAGTAGASRLGARADHGARLVELLALVGAVVEIGGELAVAGARRFDQRQRVLDREVDVGRQLHRLLRRLGQLHLGERRSRCPARRCPARLPTASGSRTGWRRSAAGAGQAPRSSRCAGR